MINIKYCLLFIVFSIIYSLNYASGACPNSKSHDLILGKDEPGVRMLDSIHEKAPKKFFRKQVRDIEWPLRGQTNHAKITKIEVLDQGPQGCASVTGGGVGSSFVKFHLKSERNKKLDFLIKIYGN